jgi:hypothetical protein
VKAHVIPAVRGFDATLRIETEANDGPILRNAQIETLRQGVLNGQASDAYMVSMPMGTFERIIATLTHQAAKRYHATSVNVQLGALALEVARERLRPGMPVVSEALGLTIDGKLVPFRAFTLRAQVGDVVEFDVEGVALETESVQHGMEILALGSASRSDDAQAEDGDQEDGRGTLLREVEVLVEEANAKFIREGNPDFRAPIAAGLLSKLARKFGLPANIFEARS